MRNYTKIYITPKGERAARSGHPWVYADEITNIEGAYVNGDLVDVVNNKGKYLGTGFINDNSKIKVRIISTNTNDKFDTAFMYYPVIPLLLRYDSICSSSQIPRSSQPARCSL